MPLPEFLKPLLVGQYGSDLAELVLNGCRRRRTTLRTNALKASADRVAAALGEAGLAFERVPWYADAFVLDEGVRERAVWDLPLYTEGGLYLQSLSSMLPPLVLAPRAGADVLDMCAAPGGKTTQMAALSGGGAHITACEMHMPRAEKLRFNLERQGVRGVNVMQVDARRLDDFFRFDQILLDAPCSGSGTLDADDPKVPRRFTPELVKKSCASQKALLSKALRLLKPGGTLVYSTCSVLACENEDVVRSCLSKAGREGSYVLEKVVLAGSDGGAFALPELPTGLPGTLCVMPTDVFEGFFLAKITRTA